MAMKDFRRAADSRIDPSSIRFADLVVRNARIHTGDPRRPSASSVAITDGVFTAVGDGETVAADIGPATRVVDALGRRVIPGLNDSHMHVVRGGLNYLLELRWDGVRSLRAGLAMLAQQVERTPPGSLGQGRGGLERRPIRGGATSDRRGAQRGGS
jgi:predicted amidohydrolase YtcJ